MVAIKIHTQAPPIAALVLILQILLTRPQQYRIVCSCITWSEYILRCGNNKVPYGRNQDTHTSTTNSSIGIDTPNTAYKATAVSHCVQLHHMDAIHLEMWQQQGPIWSQSRYTHKHHQ